MLNIELIRFDAQDIITTSVAGPVGPVGPAASACEHEADTPSYVLSSSGESTVCNKCGTTGTVFGATVGQEYKYFFIWNNKI